MAVSDGFDDDDEDPPFGSEETTPIAERSLMRCLPCLGTGRLRLLGVELYETLRPCPYCKGLGSRIVLLRGKREVFVADEMKFAQLGRCKGAFRAGTRAPFGRVVCPECGARLRPLPGLRMPNHKAARGGPPPASRK